MVGLLIGGCREAGRQGAPARLDLESDTIELPATAAIVDVRLRGASGDGAIDPPLVRVHSGDVVRFLAGDAAGHAIAFAAGDLSTAQRDFLIRTGQLSSPPLLVPGAAWLVNLEGAPPGDYLFHCVVHDVAGRIRVRAGH